MRDILCLFPYLKSKSKKIFDDLCISNNIIHLVPILSNNTLNGKLFPNKALNDELNLWSFEFIDKIKVNPGINIDASLEHMYSLEHVIFEFYKNRNEKGYGFLIIKESEINDEDSVFLGALGTSYGGITHASLGSLEKCLINGADRVYDSFNNFSFKKFSSFLNSLTNNAFMQFFIDEPKKGEFNYNYRSGIKSGSKPCNLRDYNFELIGVSRFDYSVDCILQCNNNECSPGCAHKNGLFVSSKDNCEKNNALLTNKTVTYLDDSILTASNDLLVNPLFINYCIQEMKIVGEFIALNTDFTNNFSTNLTELLLRNNDDFILVQAKYSDSKGLICVYKTNPDGLIKGVNNCFSLTESMSSRINVNGKNNEETLELISGQKFSNYFISSALYNSKDNAIKIFDDFIDFISYAKKNNLSLKGSYNDIKEYIENIKNNQKI